MSASSLNLILGLIGSYLLGSIPTAYLLVRLKLHEDIRQLGSGTVGTRNVNRVLGWRAALLVFLLDAAKGAGAVLLCYLLGVDDYLGVAMAVAGHIFPIWLKFRGGKGLATAFGGILALGQWTLLLVFGLIWLPNYFLIWSKRMAVATLAGALGALIYALMTKSDWGLILMAVVISIRHLLAIREENASEKLVNVS